MCSISIVVVNVSKSSGVLLVLETRQKFVVCLAYV